MKPTFRTAALLAAALSAASCALPVPFPDKDKDEGTRSITGSLLVPDEADLPPDASLVVSFRGMEDEVLTENRSLIEDRAPPFPFQLRVPSDRVGSLRARVEAGEDTTLQSVSVLLDEGSEPVDVGSLVLEPVEESFTPAAGMVAGRRMAEALPAPQATEEPAAMGNTSSERASVAAEAAAMPAAPMNPGPLEVTCGASSLTVVEEDGAAQVRVGEIVVEMEAAGAANGARRYAVQDDPATFLTLDDEAVGVSLAGVELSDCVLAGNRD